jgi:hypothetical protein
LRIYRLRRRLLRLHFADIRERLLAALVARRRNEDRAASASAAELSRLLADPSALVGYLQLALDENERLVAFLHGLEEAGTISREELELLMGLRQE